MSFSPAARRRVEAEADARLARIKARAAAQIRRVQVAVDPPLRNSELALGLELDVREVGRILSGKSRARRVVPDGPTQVALDALEAGELLLAVGPPHEGRRPVLLCERGDVLRLARSWAVADVTGRPVERGGADDWEDEDAWDLFGGVGRGAPDASSAPPPVLGARPTAPLAGRELSRLGLGCMRLSTAGRPDPQTARAVLEAALAAGVDWFDTADAYAVDETELGHNERLLAACLHGREDVLVATKGGLRRQGARWLPAGRPDELRRACERSLTALGVERIDLYQLHAPDRRVPIEEAVGALAELQRAGKIDHVGLCNVTVEQLDAARAVCEIASVQNKANPFDRKQLEGVVQRCAELGIPFVAHSPLGGHAGVDRVAKDPGLGAVAERHGVSPHAIALAWLLDLGPHVRVIPGATRPERLRENAAALAIRLSDDDRAILDGRFPPGAAIRDACRPTPEVVVVMGIPAAGKTSHVQPYVRRGYHRLNRDELGGRLDGLVPRFDAAARAGETRFVLDNTYPTRASRAGLLEAAERRGLPVRCVWLDTPEDEARVNAVKRVLERRGDLLSPDELRVAARHDPNLFPPSAQRSWLERFEEPTPGEGFTRVERLPFVRRWPLEPAGQALLLDYDGTLRRTRSGRVYPVDPDDVEVLPGRAEVLRAWRADGYRLLGVSNQSGVATGHLTHAQAQACFERTNELLGLEVEVAYCPHPPGAPRCWCRKPMPGLGVRFVLAHRLDPARCVMVGDLESDRAFAAACGFEYRDAASFFDGRKATAR